VPPRYVAQSHEPGEGQQLGPFPHLCAVVAPGLRRLKTAYSLFLFLFLFRFRFLFRSYCIFFFLFIFLSPNLQGICEITQSTAMRYIKNGNQPFRKRWLACSLIACPQVRAYPHPFRAGTVFGAELRSHSARPWVESPEIASARIAMTSKYPKTAHFPGKEEIAEIRDNSSLPVEESIKDILDLSRPQFPIPGHSFALSVTGRR
jgi:hypothetical protein